MYQYDQYDQRAVQERAAQFLGQVERRLSGEILEDEFKPLRLQNGLYMQLHGYMLRVAIPYGLLSSKQIRKFAHIARTYDKGYGHLTTRQNLQYNWLKLQEHEVREWAQHPRLRERFPALVELAQASDATLDSLRDSQPHHDILALLLPLLNLEDVRAINGTDATGLMVLTSR